MCKLFSFPKGKKSASANNEKSISMAIEVLGVIYAWNIEVNLAGKV